MTRPAPVQDHANFISVVVILVANAVTPNGESGGTRIHDIHARRITGLTNGGLADLELSKSGQ